MLPLSVATAGPERQQTAHAHTMHAAKQASDSHCPQNCCHFSFLSSQLVLFDVNLTHHLCNAMLAFKPECDLPSPSLGQFRPCLVLPAA